jgi:hypothetical protein
VALNGRCILDDIPTDRRERWAQALGDAELRTEQPGESPLAWQGGQLSKLIGELAGSVRPAA